MKHQPDPDTQPNLSGYGQIVARLVGHAGNVRAPTAPSYYSCVATPLGRMLVITTNEALLGLHFDAHERTPALGHSRHRSSAPFLAVRRQLDEYFRGTRSEFDLPIRPQGTPFQLTVWSALLDIPYGEISTYARMAERLGRPLAARAVGAANGRNPISIVIPCHRLVGADGALTGYGWGLDRKRRLLELEHSYSGGRGAEGGATVRRSGG